MSAAEFGFFTIALLGLLAAAHVCGYLFTRLHQPRVAGEILAGVVIGPTILGHVAPEVSAFFADQLVRASHRGPAVVGFLYNFGLSLLMFASGAETNRLFPRQDLRVLACLGIIGTVLPFTLTLMARPLLPLEQLAGSNGSGPALLLVVGIAMAVTSIPVISKIFHDLAILHTRFASIVLGIAVLEDAALWAVLALAMALAKGASLSYEEVGLHLVTTTVYFAVGLMVIPELLRRIGGARWNLLARASPVGYVVTILLAYCAVAAFLDVNLVFAAFLAGYALVARTDQHKEAVHVVSDVAFGVFVPLYFALVGYQLDLGRSFSATMLVIALAVASGVKLFSAGLGARVTGLGWSDSFNVAMALNARGGPGIVLASVAFDAGIINTTFFTTLVLVAVLTSQMAGAWLGYVLRAGRPLLSEQAIASSPPRPAVAPSASRD